MCHQRSQVPTKLVPKNQRKHSQNHGEEYNKKCNGIWLLQFIQVSLFWNSWLETKCNCKSNNGVDINIYIWVGFIGAVISTATIFSYSTTLSPPKKCTCLYILHWYVIIFGNFFKDVLARIFVEVIVFLKSISPGNLKVLAYFNIQWPLKLQREVVHFVLNLCMLLITR